MINRVSKLMKELEQERQRVRERQVLQAMRTKSVDEFIEWVDECVFYTLDEKEKEDLRKRHEIENSALSKVMREKE